MAFGFGLDNCTTKPNVTCGHMKVAGFKRSGCFHHPPHIPADDAVVGARHSDIALKRSAVFHDVSICSGHMGVCAQDGGYLSVKVTTEQLLVAGCFRVHINKDVLGCITNFESRINGIKWTVDRPHVDTTQQ